MTRLRLVDENNAADFELLSDYDKATRVYRKVADMLEEELPNLRPGDPDREAMAYFLEKVRKRAPR